MSTGNLASIREYRDKLIGCMPPWMELDNLDLIDYFSLSGFTYIEKTNSIIVDETEYLKSDYTLGEFKTALAIPGTGNYDDCTMDLIEEVDDDDNVKIYTNPNIIMLDSMAEIIREHDEHRDMLLTEMNPRLATKDGMLTFWETVFQSERHEINGELESDADYMLRVISELFGQSSALLVIKRTFEKYGLNNFKLVNSRDDDFRWNYRAEAFSVNLHIQPEDYEKIPFLRQIFFNIAIAGIRLFIFCPAPGHECYGAFYGQATEEIDGYIVPDQFVPGSPYLIANPDSPSDTPTTQTTGYGASYGAFYGNS